MSDKKVRRAAKAAQNYEQYPPRCGSCVRFTPPRLGVPGGAAYAPGRCGLGGFAASPGGICDQWRGRDGSVLEVSA